MTHSIKASPSWLRSSRSSSSGCTALTSHHRAAPCMSFLLSPHSVDEAAAAERKSAYRRPEFTPPAPLIPHEGLLFLFPKPGEWGRLYKEQHAAIADEPRGNLHRVCRQPALSSILGAHMRENRDVLRIDANFPQLNGQLKKKKKEQKHRVLNFFYR